LSAFSDQLSAISFQIVAVRGSMPRSTWDRPPLYSELPGARMSAAITLVSKQLMADCRSLKADC